MIKASCDKAYTIHIPLLGGSGRAHAIVANVHVHTYVPCVFIAECVCVYIAPFGYTHPFRPDLCSGVRRMTIKTLN